MLHCKRQHAQKFSHYYAQHFLICHFNDPITGMAQKSSGDVQSFILIKILLCYQPDPKQSRKIGGIAYLHFKSNDDKIEDNKIQVLIHDDAYLDPAPCENLELVEGHIFEDLRDIAMELNYVFAELMSKNDHKISIIFRYMKFLEWLRRQKLVLVILMSVLKCHNLFMFLMVFLPIFNVFIFIISRIVWLLQLMSFVKHL